MAETLLALLLVTTSAKGSSLIFRWPELPSPSPRLSRPKPEIPCSLSQLDNPWRASHSQEVVEKAEGPPPNIGNDPDYCWQRPNALRDSRGSPSRDRAYSLDKVAIPNEYDHVLGYSAEFLANLLCPQRSMCHQKFELVVDDLAFIGHPVCADSDGGWRFKPEKIKTGSRGRETREYGNSASPHIEDITSLSPETPSSEPPSASKSSWLHTFHFALVLDLPDPSSSASGNLSKYFNILYEQIAFTLAAVLYQEQVLSNFVEKECDILSSLKESCISKGEPFSRYVSQAFEVSSIAPAMKSIYEAIKNSSMAYVTINYLPLELQLPPYLDILLHSQEDQETDLIDSSDEDEALTWGQEMSLGWKLPTMAPWKSLLLFDIDNDMDPHMILRGPHDNAEDRTLAEGLVRFLETASVTMSLSDMANGLDWDLESQVYPIVRWLVLHRRAKVVDAVHAGLKTVFTLPPKFGTPLSQLSAEFQEAFSHPSVPPLPRILATISTSMSKQTDNHFFASVVKSKELIPMYHDVVVWMLKRDMLITLHLRIRVVATRDLKMRVKAERKQKLARKFARGAGARRDGSGSSSGRPADLDIDDLTEEGLSSATTSAGVGLILSPRTARNFARRISSNDSGRSEISELDFREEHLEENGAESEGDSNSELDEEDSGWDTTEDHLWPSMINDPGKATPMQRRWLSAMSEGKESSIAKRFELINQYFDGRKSDDEILYRAEISRKQLREVLHHYEEYLQTFLHPS
ncbi:nitrogen permease regulator of amino acid transport activity 3-domain-containing protein [Crassisporium funariophilum]|nr:nitrogen permease regulator of amino acid transport activity 3-domain-containing protein [Crassisporium funariophilum]